MSGQQSFQLHQEGLPDYWGIETGTQSRFCIMELLIRKDYPTTGVLKLSRHGTNLKVEETDQEGLPDYWGIETYLLGTASVINCENQEGLPDYWGIETNILWKDATWSSVNQEGLPDYWGIETGALGDFYFFNWTSGRITRLLGY